MSIELKKELAYVLSMKQEKLINEFVISKDMDGECSICLEKFKSGSSITILPCGHVFTTNCIDEWFCKELTCPECRDNISSNKKNKSLHKDIGKECELYSDLKLKIYMNSELYFTSSDYVSVIGFNKNKIIFMTKCIHLQNINDVVTLIRNLPIITNIVLYVTTLDKIYRVNILTHMIHRPTTQQTIININISYDKELLSFVGTIEQFVDNMNNHYSVLYHENFEVQPAIWDGERTYWIEKSDGTYKWSVEDRIIVNYERPDQPIIVTRRNEPRRTVSSRNGVRRNGVRRNVPRRTVSRRNVPRRTVSRIIEPGNNVQRTASGQIDANNSSCCVIL
jgi:hypothetical protein